MQPFTVPKRDVEARKPALYLVIDYDPSDCTVFRSTSDAAALRRFKRDYEGRTSATLHRIDEYPIKSSGMKKTTYLACYADGEFHEARKQ